MNEKEKIIKFVKSLMYNAYISVFEFRDETNPCVQKIVSNTLIKIKAYTTVLKGIGCPDVEIKAVKNKAQKGETLFE